MRGAEAAARTQAPKGIGGVEVQHSRPLAAHLGTCPLSSEGSLLRTRRACNQASRRLTITSSSLFHRTPSPLTQPGRPLPQLDGSGPAGLGGGPARHARRQGRGRHAQGTRRAGAPGGRAVPGGGRRARGEAGEHHPCPARGPAGDPGGVEAARQRRRGFCQGGWVEETGVACVSLGMHRGIGLSLRSCRTPCWTPGILKPPALPHAHAGRGVRRGGAAGGGALVDPGERGRALPVHMWGAA